MGVLKGWLCGVQLHLELGSWNRWVEICKLDIDVNEVSAHVNMYMSKFESLNPHTEASEVRWKNTKIIMRNIIRKRYQKG